jgi:hypothetical protein
MRAERGMLYQKQRDYRRAVKELAKATELDAGNAQVRAMVGGVEAHEASSLSHRHTLPQLMRVSSVNTPRVAHAFLQVRAHHCC